ncbi:hypothetical protein [Luteolibacter luteus]|uniref:Uncharacterized protein n=1 Tax=Luteolibacter luteus TaxID=2728835 RepID=A0A858RR94_9BACT|nr:hypothetical protein [Luteolibacter luteus]QJE98918.1 hypothetical protein HHL09_25115 [Luteolibacter luteus]
MAEVFFHVQPGIGQKQLEHAFRPILRDEAAGPPQRLYPDAEPGTKDSRAFYVRLRPETPAEEALDRIKSLELVERASIPARRGL